MQVLIEQIYINKVINTLIKCICLPRQYGVRRLYRKPPHIFTQTTRQLYEHCALTAYPRQTYRFLSCSPPLTYIRYELPGFFIEQTIFPFVRSFLCLSPVLTAKQPSTMVEYHLQVAKIFCMCVRLFGLLSACWGWCIILLNYVESAGNL